MYLKIKNKKQRVWNLRKTMTNDDVEDNKTASFLVSNKKSFIAVIFLPFLLSNIVESFSKMAILSLI